jgi:hypothetical protein
MTPMLKSKPSRYVKAHNNLWKIKMAKFISGRLLVASVGLLATILLPAFAWADGFYVDLHGGATIFNNDAARVTPLTSGGSVHAHTNYDTGWLAGSSAGYE